MENKTNQLLDMYSVKVVEWKDMDKRKFYSLGPAMFVGLRGILYPFGLIKTRLFLQRKTDMYKGTFDAFRQVVKYEGFRGLYKGFLASNFGLVSGQLYITVYEMTRSYLDGYSTGVKSFTGGLMGSLVAQTVTVPVDIVSQNLMVQGQVGSANVGDMKKRAKLKGAFTLTRDIVRNEGFLGLYRGYAVSLMTYAPGSAIWWSSYMVICDALLHSSPLEHCPRPVLFVASGMCAAVVSSSSTNVMDLVRTRYQLESNLSLRACMKKLWQEEGLAILYKGLSARIMQNAPTDQAKCVDVHFCCEANHFPDCAEGSEEKHGNITDTCSDNGNKLVCVV